MNSRPIFASDGLFGLSSIGDSSSNTSSRPVLASGPTLSRHDLSPTSHSKLSVCRVRRFGNSIGSRVLANDSRCAERMFLVVFLAAKMIPSKAVYLLERSMGLVPNFVAKICVQKAQPKYAYELLGSKPLSYRGQIALARQIFKKIPKISLNRETCSPRSRSQPIT